jgi:hypothetical protein
MTRRQVGADAGAADVTMQGAGRRDIGSARSAALAHGGRVAGHSR